MRLSLKHNKSFYWAILLGMLLGNVLLFTQQARADRLKDITSIAGVRPNQLIGYGLVVGLDGTGDKTDFTKQTFRNMMAEFGIAIPEGEDPKFKNVAAVSVHATLPAFSKPGQAIDVTVSSLGDAKSLRGGSLLLTPLRGADNQVYAVAQGNLVVGGFGVDGNDGSSVTVNVPSVGRIPNGATVERTVPSNFSQGDAIVLNLNHSDFTTARRVVDRINNLFGPGSARALDATSVRVGAPRDPSQRVQFLSILENIEVTPAESKARVVINSRTGTIVIGKHVKIDPVAVTHGSLTVSITEDFQISQPDGLGDGTTAVVPDTQIDAEQEENPMFLFGPTTTLDDVVRAVNEVGAAPGDLMAILEALRQAGALKADIVVI